MHMMKNTNSGQRSAVSGQQSAALSCPSWLRGFVALSLLMFSGCQQLGAFWAVFVKGGETLEAEYKLAPGPLAVVLDDTEQLGVPADAMRAFHEALTKEFQDEKVNKQVVAFTEVQKLRQNDHQYDDLSIRQIGEKLGADQVLYCKVTYWALRERPGDPHFKGKCTVGVKVDSTERKRDVKLWPADRDFVVVTAYTDPDLNESAGAEAQVARQLGEKLAAAVGTYFHGHKSRDRLE